jgi:hypothetical protein
MSFAPGLAEFQLEDGGSVLIQVAPANGTQDGVTRSWGDRNMRVVEQAHQSFERAIAQVQPAIQSLLTQLTSLAESPDQVEVEFALQLNAEVGAFVAGASTSGNFKVTMTWNR